MTHHTYISQRSDPNFHYFTKWFQAFHHNSHYSIDPLHSDPGKNQALQKLHTCIFIRTEVKTKIEIKIDTASQTEHSLLKYFKQLIKTLITKFYVINRSNYCFKGKNTLQTWRTTRAFPGQACTTRVFLVTLVYLLTFNLQINRSWISCVQQIICLRRVFHRSHILYQSTDVHPKQESHKYLLSASCDFLSQHIGVSVN